MRETKRLRRRLLERGLYSVMGVGGGVISGGFASGGAYYRQFTVNRRSRLCDAGLGHNLRVYKLLLPLKVSSLLGTNNAGVTDFIQIVMSLHKSVAAQSPEKSDFSVSDPGGSEEKELTEKFSLSCSHQAKIISTSAHKHISTFCSPSSMQNVCHMTLAPISLLYLSWWIGMVSSDSSSPRLSRFAWGVFLKKGNKHGKTVWLHVWKPRVTKITSRKVC